MSSRLSDAINKEGFRNSMGGRPPPSPSTTSAQNKRLSALDADEITRMFPDAAAAIAQKRADYAQQYGNDPPSNRNSQIFGNRSSLVTPTISAPDPRKDLKSPSWRTGADPQGSVGSGRPKSSSGQPPMGQFSQPPPSAGLRSPRPPALATEGSNIQTTTLSAGGPQDLPILSPYNVNGSWASMTNTPMVPNFNQADSQAQSKMLADATSMKLAAISTHNNRINLDDPKRFQRRARSSEGNNQPPLSPGFINPALGTNVVMVDTQGQVLNAQQIAALQAQQQASMLGRRSRPNSPGIAMQGGLSGLNFVSPQNNGFLSTYDQAALLNNSMAGMNLGSYGAGSEGYLSDHSEMRGRSPRGRRGSSKPPEDPTDPTLLQDIPSWLRSLRLHKYTDNLKDLKWTDLVELDDQGLEDRGVNALGARRKMLKVRLFNVNM